MNTNLPSVETLFAEALEIPSAGERAAYLERACAGDEGLRRHVETLLEAHDRAGRFLDPPALAATADRPRPAEGPGAAVGPYKLMEQIGEGGMGAVYVAEQHHPVRRKVALKIIKPGMDSRQVVARFEAERQALAMMDHPNIARVHDGGATASGRPFFVMELVRGIPITDYCDRERLSIPERLDLFVLVCRAVQHAHQKGVIHRDLKPSNILVTVIDGAAVPKVIDFGVAKATGASLTERTVYTAFQQFVGTPLYMSPEQADLSGMDVDTRSDIYSLGVLLYELLTGTTPFDQETFRQAAFDEVRRIIREQEPPKPSTRLSSLGATRATVSANRKADARHLDRAVRGELDWIVMKALEKDRRRRYETANDFASDVTRYLTDQPVQACPPSAWYRVRKFASRNRRGLATTALLTASALIVAVALGAVYLQNLGRVRRVTQDVREALAGARTAIDARDLALAGQRVSEAQGRLGADAASQRDLAAEISGIRREIDARQADAARLSQFLKGASDAQDKMGFGKGQGGDRVAEEALGLYGVLTEKDWSSRLESSYLTADQKQQVRETAYVTLVSLADYYIRWRGSEPKSVERSLDLLQRAQAFHQPTRAFYFVRAECRRRQGNTAAADEDEKQFKAATARTAWDYYLPGHTAGWGGDLDEAIRSYRAALRLQPNHYNSLFFLARRLATDKINRRPEAVAYFTGCIAFRPDHVAAYQNRAACYCKLGQRDAANADFEAACTVAKTDPERCGGLALLAAHLLEKDQHQDLRELIAQVEEVSRRVRWEDHQHPVIVHVMEHLANDYIERREYSKAEPFRVQALDVSRRVRGEEHPQTLAVMHNLAVVYMEQGKFVQAEPLFVRALEGQRRTLGRDDPALAGTLASLGLFRLVSKKYAGAEPLLRECLAIRAEKLPDDWLRFNAMSMLGAALAGQKKYAEAEPFLVQGYEGMKQREGKIPPDVAKVRLTQALERLVQLYEDWGHPEKAAAWKARLGLVDLPENVFARP
jgi:serine/threonine protein kinase/tetratricopeptide (TPR) repeat protein